MAVSGWTPCRLGDLVKIEHGWPFKSELFTEVRSGRPVVVSVGNFRYTGGFRFDETSVKEYLGTYPKQFELSPGDVLLVMTCQTAGGEILGIPAKAPDDGHVYLHNQRLGKVVVRDTSRVRLDFLYWLFLWSEFNRELVTSASGTKILHTAPSRIEAFRFLLPPIEEQHAIATILDSLENKIGLNRESKETLASVARAIFKSWFIDFDPVHAKMEGRSPGISADIAAIFPRQLVQNEDGEIPEGWTLKPLSSLGRFLNGLALQKFPPKGDEFLPVIKIAELRAGRWTNGDKASTSIPDEYVVHDGDLLFSWSGSLLQRFWCGGRGALNQHLFKVIPLGVSSGFLFEAIAQHMPEFRAIAADKATTMGHIQRRHLDEALVAVGPDALMKMASAIIGLYHERALLCEKQSRTLTDIRDLLIPKLMSGKIRVKDAQRLLKQSGV